MTNIQAILRLLKACDDNELSSAEICRKLGVSRTAVWKHIKALRDQGYVIEGQSRRGYRLIKSPDVPSEDEVRALLRTARLGSELHYSGITESTNADAANAAEKGCAEGVVFCAGAQRGGRGRMNRRWFSPPDVNLYFSLVLRPTVPVSQAASLPLVAGIAVATAVENLTAGLQPQVKWPNDIQVNGKKICGILCEMQAELDCRVRHIVVGTGINVNLTEALLPAELRNIATSLLIATGMVFSRSVLLAAILNEFEPLYDVWQRQGFAPLTGVLERYDALAGREVTVQQGKDTLTGVADGVQSDGALLVKCVNGVIPVYSGEASVRV